MKFTVKHEKKGRIRVHLFQKYMNFTQADTLQYYLENLDGVKKAQVFNRTSDALIYYTGERNELLKAIQAFGYSRVSVPAQVLENSGRELNETYKEKLVNKVIFHYGRKLLLPYPLSAIYTTAMSVKYIWLGVKTLWKRKIEVPVLDATAIGVSIFLAACFTAENPVHVLAADGADFFQHIYHAVNCGRSNISIFLLHLVINFLAAGTLLLQNNIQDQLALSGDPAALFA